MADNLLYYGDNLEILRHHIQNESVDLIYLDPPFKSNQDYNILFREKDGTQAAAQVRAFEDTWHWDLAAVAAYQEGVEKGGRVSQALQAFHTLLGGNDMLAYLSMMALRLVELRRVLKPDGSIYLHCDPSASHYLKMLMDAIFLPWNFRNEIIWRRTGAHGKSRRFGPIHDTILFYTKSDSYSWFYPKRPYMKGHVEQYFVQDEKGWRTNYYGNVLTGSGLRGGESGKPWRGFDPSAKGRHWQVPKSIAAEIAEEEGFSEMTQHQKLDRLLELGYIKIVPGQAWPIYEHYLKPGDGQAVSDIWAYQPYTEGTVFGTEEGIDADVRWLSPQDQERLGYPTQKPTALLERILEANSKKGDVVLDPFCGCGTTIAAAQKLERRWIGIDITHLAITLIKNRLRQGFTKAVEGTYKVYGEPVSLPDAEALAKHDRFQFQCWAVGKLGASPLEPKKGADRGIDGRIFFHDDPQTNKTKTIILSVKSGKAQPTDVRDLRGVIERERAAIGVFITMHNPTREMNTEAASAGFYESPFAGHKVPRLQIITVEDILAGKEIMMPPVLLEKTFKKAPRVRMKEKEGHRQSIISFDEESE